MKRKTKVNTNNWPDAASMEKKTEKIKLMEAMREDIAFI